MGTDNNKLFEFFDDELPSKRDWKPGEGYTFPNSPMPDIEKVIDQLRPDTLALIERDLKVAVRRPTTRYDREINVIFETWEIVRRRLS